MTDFYHVYNRENIIKDKIFFKNPHNPLRIDLLITNRQKSFQNSTERQIGLSDFHEISLTVMKVFYKKQCPRIVRYGNYRKFDKELPINKVKNSIELEYCLD